MTRQNVNGGVRILSRVQVMDGSKRGRFSETNE